MDNLAQHQQLRSYCNGTFPTKQHHYPLYVCKVIPEYKGPESAELHFFVALSQAPVYTAGPWVTASCVLPSYNQAFAGTHCAYTLWDGWAELNSALVL